MPRRTDRPHDLRALLAASPGRRTVGKSVGEQLAGKGHDGGTATELVIVLPLPPRILHPNARPHWAALARAKKSARVEAFVATVGARAVYRVGGCPWPKCEALPAFYFPDARRRDSDGMTASAKAYIDGVVDAGVVIDDSADCLTLLPPTVAVDKANPRLELVIRRL